MHLNVADKNDQVDPVKHDSDRKPLTKTERNDINKGTLINTQKLKEPCYDGEQPVVQGGIIKHIYSTGVLGLGGSGLYIQDRTGLNNTTARTINNDLYEIGTDVKINPFNVIGVKGCKKCKGSGWIEDKYPHPCNKCAKKTVPKIQTIISKTGLPNNMVFHAPVHVIGVPKKESEPGRSEHIPNRHISAANKNMVPISEVQSRI